MVSYGISHKGFVRKENQDAYINIDTFIGQLDNIYIIADGMGGHKGGAIASKLAIDSIVDYLKDATGSVESIIKECIQKANDAIYRLAVEDGSLFGMGTTLDVISVKDQHIYIGHVGDSRVYYMNKHHELEQITKDHSYVQELLDSNAITEEEAYNHPNKNRITRAVGVDTHVDIDFIDIKISKNLKLQVIACSDGLTNMLKNDVIKETIELDVSLQNKCENLLNQSLENGGTDNVTIVLIEEDKGWWQND